MTKRPLTLKRRLVYLTLYLTAATICSALAITTVQHTVLDADLIAAIKRSDSYGVEKLLRLGADPNARAFLLKSVRSPSWSFPSVVSRMHIARSNSQSALIVALDENPTKGPNQEIVLSLIAAGADVNVADQYGRTPLVMLFSRQRRQRSRLKSTGSMEEPSMNARCEIALILAGANPNVCNDLGLPLCEATTDCTALRLLSARGVNISTTRDGRSRLANLGVTGSKSEICCLLDLGADVNQHDRSGWTCLTYVCQSGNLELVRLLLSRGADINANAGHGRTPLMAAVSGSYYKVARILLEAGADVRAKDENGWTALMWAVNENDLPCAGLLMDKGATVSLKSLHRNYGCTARGCDLSPGAAMLKLLNKKHALAM